MLKNDEGSLRLTRNEKKALKLLLGNARISDSAIAAKLNISSQAVGKIRRKVEKTVVDSYTANLNYSKLGIQTFAIAIAKMTMDGLDKGELEVEQKLLKDPHVMQVYRLPSGSATHLIFYGFRDMSELDNFFHSREKKNDIHNFIENKEMFTFSHNSLIKNSPVQLFCKVIDEMNGNGNSNGHSGKYEFSEIEKFKSRLD
jgi:DNA-binding Lrp family transcriptional regulator